MMVRGCNKSIRACIAIFLTATLILAGTSLFNFAGAQSSQENESASETEFVKQNDEQATDTQNLTDQENENQVKKAEDANEQSESLKVKEDEIAVAPIEEEKKQSVVSATPQTYTVRLQNWIPSERGRQDLTVSFENAASTNLTYSFDPDQLSTTPATKLFVNDDGTVITPKRDGYTFNGWYYAYSNASGTIYNKIDSTSTLSTVFWGSNTSAIVYPIWIAKPAEKLTINISNAEGGNVKIDGQTISTDVTKDVIPSATSLGFTVEATANAGYSFAFWLDQNGDIAYFGSNRAPATFGGNYISGYAWKGQKLTPIFVRDGKKLVAIKHYLQNSKGEYVEDPATFERVFVDEATQINVAPSRINNYVISTQKLTTYEDSGNVAQTDPLVVAADNTSVMKVYYDRLWKLSFVMNGHGDAVQAQNLIAGASPTLFEDPIADGYVFDGWFSDKALSDKIDIATYTMPMSDVTLYAKWTKSDPDNPDPDPVNPVDPNDPNNPNSGDGSEGDSSSTSAISETGDLLGMQVLALLIALGASSFLGFRAIRFISNKKRSA